MKTILKKIMMNINILVFLPGYILLILNAAYFHKGKEPDTPPIQEEYKVPALKKTIQYFINLSTYKK